MANRDERNEYATAKWDAEEVRRQADVLETLTDKAHWPFPTYSDLLFY